MALTNGLIVSVRLDGDEANRFLEFCDRHNLNRSEFLRQLVSRTVEADTWEPVVTNAPTRARIEREDTV